MTATPNHATMKPVIRHLRLKEGELRVTCGKSDEAKVQLKTGMTEYVGAD